MNPAPPTSPTPTVDDVDRIAALSDPALRNLQITQCYHELSAALARRTGGSANWCTFAAWASRQAGQSIRKQDLHDALEHAVHNSPETAQAAQDVSIQAQAQNIQRRPDEVLAALKAAIDLRLIVDRVAEAVGRGNKKVFEEIGREFAKFLDEFPPDAPPDERRIEQFCARLRPGEPPQGQEYLRRAFRRYYRAFYTEDAKRRAELLLCANIEIGLHEQTRLQPEIAEAMDAAFVNTSRLTRRIILTLFPASGLVYSTMWLGRKLLRRATLLEQAVQVYRAAVQVQMRRALTDALMTIRIPPDRVVRLGDDLAAAYPPNLRRLVDPDLLSLLAIYDPTPDSTAKSGALDWASLPNRLHFIADLFRCYQETPSLLEAPFTAEQIVAIRAGRIPGGRL